MGRERLIAVLLGLVMIALGVRILVRDDTMAVVGSRRARPLACTLRVLRTFSLNRKSTLDSQPWKNSLHS